MSPTLTPLLKAFPLIVLLTVMAPGQTTWRKLQFEAVSVKLSDRPPTSPEEYARLAQLGQSVQPTGCYVGPSMLQYNCKGSVPKLLMEALNMSDFQYKETGPPMYTITAKLSKPATRPQMDAMLKQFLLEKMEVRYHVDKRPIKGVFLTLESRELLKNLPLSNEPIPNAMDESFLGVPSNSRFHTFVVARRGFPKGTTEIQCNNITFRLFAEVLYRYYGYQGRVPVIDETGLDRRFNLNFTMISDEEGKGGTNLSEIRQALAKFGIGLQTRQGVTDFVVVDHVADQAKFLD